MDRSNLDCHRDRQPSAVKNDLTAVGLANLDVFDADAELAVGLLGQVGVSLRPDTRDVRPRRRQALGPLEDVGHDLRSAVRRRGEPGERHAGSRHVGPSRGPRGADGLSQRCPRDE